MTRPLDAVVVGSGPNGLSCAIELARAGKKVLVLEARDTVGGGTRSAELTLPGLIHDVCSAVHPLGVSSPFFSVLPLAQHGLEWIHPPALLAHPLDGGRAAVMVQSIDGTARMLGRDGAAYARLMKPLVRDWPLVAPQLLGPLSVRPHPLRMARFGFYAARPVSMLARQLFRTEEARVLIAGVAAHSTLPLENLATSAFALMLMVAGHARGWPVPRGGSQSIANALADHLRTLGGAIRTGVHVDDINALPRSERVFLNVTPLQVLQMAGAHLPESYRGRLASFRYGPGVFKVDWALDGPIPWSAEGCRHAGTVHLGGTLEELEQSEAEVNNGGHPERPFVLLAQQSLFDETRTTLGRQVAWAYCHVPNGSTVDMAQRIEAQVERFAPGFRNRILARHTTNTAQLQAYNNNDVGGDINGGFPSIAQLFTRPVASLDPYATPNPRIFICSASTPPGGGVHGMCGFHAARSALRRWT